MSTPRSGNPGRPPGTMTTAVLYAPRDLRIEQRPVPTPSEGEVLVRTPLVLGHESSGQIVEVGKGVSSARVGERVAIEPGAPCGRCDQCGTGRYNLCPNIRF